MANLQKQFEEFYDLIRLNNVEENQTLREKRDIILDRLKKNISNGASSYTHFNQGSYAMNTGVVPIDNEFDIDVGICFDISKDDYEDPTEVKGWVFEAVKDHTSNVQMRKPCVTVTYIENGEPAFHVDLAIYAANNTDGKLYLARGKQNSGEEYKVWEVSDPRKLIGLINEHFEDTEDRAQFRRVIRYLKRWKDINFVSNGNAAPIGVGLTVGAYYYLTISKKLDFASGNYKYNDLDSLRMLTQSLLDEFTPVYSIEEQKYVDRISIKLPTEPYNDLFQKMTDKQMENFRNKLEILKSTLVSANSEVDPTKACELLQKVFGSNFPIPPEERTAKVTAPAFIGTSNSALRD